MDPPPPDPVLVREADLRFVLASNGREQAFCDDLCMNAEVEGALSDKLMSLV